MLNPEYFAIRVDNLRDRELKEKYEEIQPSPQSKQAVKSDEAPTTDSVSTAIEKFGFDQETQKAISDNKLGPVNKVMILPLSQSN